MTSLFPLTRIIQSLYYAPAGPAIVPIEGAVLFELSFPLLKKTELFLRIISLAHTPMNVTDVSIGNINCDPNNADRGRSIIRVT
jgi:hypothetical protein